MKKFLSIIALTISMLILATSLLFISACKSNELQDSGDEMQNYVLKISTDKQVYKSEEEIIIDIILENQSGTDINVAYYSPLAVPDSATGQFPAIEQSPEMTKRIFENGESICITDNLKDCFSVGQHRLNYRAIFYLGWETTESVVEVSSNTIDISIIN